VYIPKPNGKQRPLGIGSIRDRVAQMAVVLVTEPIFEADLEPEQYAYRANRSALDAIRHVHGLVNAGHTEVVDADLSSYFDEIPHAELLKSLSRRISDRHLLGLIKMWLEAPVEEMHVASLSASPFRERVYITEQALKIEISNRVQFGGDGLDIRLSAQGGPLWGASAHARPGPSPLEANSDDSPVGARWSRRHHQRPPPDPSPFARRPSHLERVVNVSPCADVG
jgi:hypothetical protein